MRCHILLLLLLVACTQVSEQPTEDLQQTDPIEPSVIAPRERLDGLDAQACREQGYAWVILPSNTQSCLEGGDCPGRCDIPTDDAGEACYASVECQGVCLCTGTTDPEGYQIGRCSSYVHFSDVRSCPCILEEKSTRESYPYGCA